MPTFADLLEAAGDLFMEVATSLHAADGVLTEAIKSDTPADLLIALRALIGKTGAMADRAYHACTGEPGVQHQDCWLLAPVSDGAMDALENWRFPLRSKALHSERGAA